MSQGQSVNTFTELNTDSAAVNTKPNVMTDAVNATLTTKGKNQLILQNMNGNEEATKLTPGFQPLGVKVYKGISYIVSGKFDVNGVFIEGEIGSFPSPDWDNLFAPGLDSEYYLPLKQEYSPLRNFSTADLNTYTQSALDLYLSDDVNYTEPFRTPKLNFRSSRLIEVEIQPSYDDSVNIVFSDDYNPVRLINSRFKVSDDGKNAAVADRRQLKDTNTYAGFRFGSTKLIRQSDQIVDLQYDGLSYGGAIKGGGYRFYFKYVDSDGALTDIIEESRLISMSYDDHGATDIENTGKTISFTLNNLDQKFSGVKVYYSRATGDTDVTTEIIEIKDIYDLPESGSSMKIVVYGTENIETISYETLNIDYSSIDTVKTLAQHDDRLVLGNVTNTTESFEGLRLSSQQLKVEESTHDLEIKTLEGGYADPSNVYHKLGYWAGETYEIGIVYILSDGRGTTPVFPIRGGDNYNNDFSYSGTTPIVAADGFIPGSSENRLGAYRTNKCKTLLKGSNSDTTEVRALRVNVSALLVDPLVQQQTEGFFFTRRERKRDAIIQGYFCNTAGIAVKQKLVPAGLKANSTVAVAGDTIQNAKTAIGATPGSEVKIVPSPGRIWENVVTSTNTGIPVGKSLSMQGKVFPDPSITTNALGENLDMYYSFYSPDQLVNPFLFASTFNGSNKGVVLNGSSQPAVQGHQFQINHTATGQGGGGIIPPYQYGWNTITSVTNNADITLKTPATGLQQTNSGNVVIDGDIDFKITGAPIGTWLGPHWTAWADGLTPIMWPPLYPLPDQVWALTPGQEWGLPIVLNVGSNGALTGGPVTASTLQTLVWWDAHDTSSSTPGNANYISTPYKQLELQFSGPITGNWTYPDGGAVTTGTWDLTFTLDVKGRTYNYTPDQVDDSKHYWDGTYSTSNLYSGIYTLSGTFTQTSFTSGSQSGNATVSAVNSLPIQDIYIDNVEFCPELSANIPDRTIQVNYIPSGQDSFSSGQFSAKSDRNIFYTMPKIGQTMGVPIVKNTASAMLAVDSIKFADYIGVKMDLYDSLLTDKLYNDPVNVRNIGYYPTNNGSGITGSDLGDWTYRTHTEGFRMAVVGNIYESPSGVMSALDWIDKYTNTSYIEPYYAVTKRIKWEDIITTADEDIDIFDGDCFINYTYKRLNYPLGVEGNPAATDPSLYEGYNLNGGLYPRGTVFPIVCENNYNTALRTYEFKDGTEKALYGKNRTFFPIDKIGSLRSSKQPESNGYNHGYHYAFSDRNYVALNNRAPALDINYGNRVMVSGASVASSFKNGYTDFSGLNFRDYNKQLGEITKLIAHNNHLFCIFEKGIGVVPMNQRTMMGGEQNGIFIDDAEVLAQKMQVISTEYGSNQQFGIIKTDEFIYGCDLNKTKVWRIVSQGESHSIELISDFAVQVILNEYKDRLDNNQLNNVVKANYDRERNNVIFSFLSEQNGNYTTDLYNLVTVGPPNIGESSKVAKEEASPASKVINIQKGGDTVVVGDNSTVTPVYNEKTQSFNPVLIETNKLGSLYFNETISKWVSQLSWNPLFTFNISNNLYSFNAIDNMDKVWKHFSESVPYCNFYGKQDKFEFEFILVDNASAQKVLNNLHFICNRTFPGRISYKIDSDVDYETFGVTDGSYTQLMKRRHEDITTPVTQYLNGGSLLLDFGVSKEEAERIEGSHFVFNNNFYIIGNTVTLNNINYVQVLDDQGNVYFGNIAGLIIDRLEFGIIKQNMEYREDHLYIEVGKGTDKSRVRDKAIKIRIIYEGTDYITIQSIISKFVYSFN